MFKTENTGSETYLIYTVGEGEVVDELSLGMLTNNKIPGVLSTACYTRDGKRLIRYQISSKVTLESYLAGTISRKKLLTIFKTITAAFLSGEEYMLEPYQFVLNVSDIYVNVSTSEAYLVCIPLDGMKPVCDNKKFFKEILFSSRFETGESGDYLLELSNYLNSDASFSISGFHQLVNRLLQGDERQTISPVRSEAKPAVPPVPLTAMPVQTPVQAPAVPAKEDGKKGLFGFGKSEKVKTDQDKKNKKDKKDKKGREDKAEKAAIPEKRPPQTVDVGGKGILIPGMEAPVVIDSAGKPGKKTEKKPAEKKAEKKSLFSFGKKKEKEEAAVPEKPVEPIIVPVFPEHRKPVMPIGETTVLGVSSGGETTVLGAGHADSPSYACLIRKKNGETIVIRNQVFRLGKEPTYVDYCIKDNSAVSRSHADILRKENGYVIVDNNSLNHTFVNGIQLVPQDQMLLADGAVVMLADEEFEFKEKGV